MKTFNEYAKINEKFSCPERGAPISETEFKRLEKLLDGLFQQLGMDIAFTKHFKERVNDARNGQQIGYCEITAIFAEVYKKFGIKLSKTKREMQEIIKSVSTNINIPIAIKYDDRRKEVVLVTKTIMRKRNFKGNDPVLRVENTMQTFTEFLEESKTAKEESVILEGEEKGDKKEYQAFFNKTLKKYGADEPDKLSPEDKKKFFDEIDAGWKGDKESD